MKKVFLTLSGAVILLFSSCANDKVIEGTYYESYGLLNSDDKKSDSIQYKLVTGNVVWSVIFCETIVVPVWLVGFSLYEPVGTSKIHTFKNK
jgi:hypothetical protein